MLKLVTFFGSFDLWKQEKSTQDESKSGRERHITLSISDTFADQNIIIFMLSSLGFWAQGLKLKHHYQTENGEFLKTI